MKLFKFTSLNCTPHSSVETRAGTDFSVTTLKIVDKMCGKIVSSFSFLLDSFLINAHMP